MSSRRTRISKGQSRNGCFTCKSRKVKCDEAKPDCTRCRKANIQCEGYPLSAYEKCLGHQQPLDHHRSETLDEQDLMSAGLELLLDSFGDELVVGQQFLRSLCRECTPSSHAAKAACITLGVAGKLQQDVSVNRDALKLRFEMQYKLALETLQLELDNTTPNPRTVLCCCILLASVELILRRRRDALVHLRGAYQVYNSDDSWLQKTSNRSGIYLATIPTNGADDLANIDDLLRIYDVQTLLFSDGARLPMMKPASSRISESFLSQTLSMSLLDREVVNLVHASLVCISTAAQNAVENIDSNSINVARANYLSSIPILVNYLNEKVRTVCVQSERLHLLVLRNICMSAFIRLHCIFSDSETSWDAHEDMFQLIISASEEILQHHHRWIQRRPSTIKPGFTPQIGILQPIFLSAVKYRHRIWRRRAIACLRRAEREGPWIGEMMAAIAERIVDLEESSAVSASNESMLISMDSSFDQSSISNQLELEQVLPGLARISLCCVMEDNGRINKSLWPTPDSGTTQIKLLRRRQPTSVLAALVLTSALSNKAENLTTHGEPIRLERHLWEQWQERIQFGPGRRYEVLWSTRISSNGIFVEATSVGSQDAH